MNIYNTNENNVDNYFYPSFRKVHTFDITY